MAALAPVRALLFDVFGTVVDWHAPVVAALAAAAAPAADDWPAFAREWRAGYLRTTLHVARGGAGPMSVDVVHRDALDAMLASPRWAHLAPRWDAARRAELVLAWHRLDPWPDAVPGLTALKQTHIIGTLSNGNIRLLVDLARHARLPWDVVFSSAFFGTYKPHADVYRGAAEHLALAPHEVALVAAHVDDCAAARRCGLRAVYVRRPSEDRGRAAADADAVADLVVDDFEELARVLARLQVRPKL